MCVQVAYKVFCHVCCKEKALGLLTLSKSYNATFVEGGFSNWKKALQRFGQHEESKIHQEAMAKLAAKFSAVDVRSQLSKQHEAEMKNHRAIFMKLLECVRYLARQGLPLRGHHEDSLTFDKTCCSCCCCKLKMMLKWDHG